MGNDILFGFVLGNNWNSENGPMHTLDTLLSLCTSFEELGGGVFKLKGE